MIIGAQPTVSGWCYPSQADDSVLFEKPSQVSNLCFARVPASVLAPRFLCRISVVTFIHGGLQIVNGNQAFTPQVAVGHGTLSQQ